MRENHQVKQAVTVEVFHTDAACVSSDDEARAGSCVGKIADIVLGVKELSGTRYCAGTSCG